MINSNSIKTALFEVQVIWSSVDEPDFVVSLGKGFRQREQHTPYISGPRAILRDGPIPRLYRVFLASLSGGTCGKNFEIVGEWTIKADISVLTLDSKEKNLA